MLYILTQSTYKVNFLGLVIANRKFESLLKKILYALYGCKQLRFLVKNH